MASNMTIVDNDRIDSFLDPEFIAWALVHGRISVQKAQQLRMLAALQARGGNVSPPPVDLAELYREHREHRNNKIRQ